jgi:hypothetical protein
MKKILILITFVLLSCSNQRTIVYKNNYDKGIPYILNANIQKLLVEKISKVKDSAYFLLDKLDSNNYEISLREYKGPVSAIKWIKNTNRFVYLNGRFYPLIFESDQVFSVQMTAKEFNDSISPDGSYTLNKIRILDEHPYRVKFNIKGEVLNEGY